MMPAIGPVQTTASSVAVVEPEAASDDGDGRYRSTDVEA